MDISTQAEIEVRCTPTFLRTRKSLVQFRTDSHLITYAEYGAVCDHILSILNQSRCSSTSYEATAGPHATLGRSSAIMGTHSTKRTRTSIHKANASAAFAGGKRAGATTGSTTHSLCESDEGFLRRSPSVRSAFELLTLEERWAAHEAKYGPTTENRPTRPLRVAANEH